MNQNPHAAAHGFDPYQAIPSGDVGWFGGDLYRSAKKSVKSVARAVVKHVPGVALAAAPYQFAADVARGRNVLKSAKRRAGGVVNSYRAALPVAASAASFVPGIGQGVGAGLNAAAALSQGKGVAQIVQAAAVGALPGGPVVNAAVKAMSAGISGGSVLDIAQAAAAGVVPQNIEAAVAIAGDALRGKNILKSALTQAAKAFVPNTLEFGGFNAARRVLEQGGDLTQLAGVRRALQSEGARRAFDVAVGHAAQAHSALKVAPRFASVPQSFIATAARRANVVAHKPVTARAAAILEQRTPWATIGQLWGRRETAGLEAGGTVYVVEQGDSPWAIAKKLTNDGNRWPELVKANPQKAVQTVGSNKGGFKTLFKGEKLKLPESWAAQHSQSISADAIGQARAILKVWGDSDGANEAGVTNYGTKPEDQTPVWGPRDKLMLVSFVNWLNRERGTGLPVSSELTDRAADALREWVAQHAATVAAPAPAPAPVPVPPPAPVPTPTPEPIAAAPAPAPAVVETPAPAYTPSTFPVQYQQLVDYAKGLKSPAQIRAYANEFRAKGMQGPADELDTFADKLEAQQFGTPDPTVPPSNVIPLTVDGQAPAKPAAPAQAEEPSNFGPLLIAAAGLAKLTGLL